MRTSNLSSGLLFKAGAILVAALAGAALPQLDRADLIACSACLLPGCSEDPEMIPVLALFGAIGTGFSAVLSSLGSLPRF